MELSNLAHALLVFVVAKGATQSYRLACLAWVLTDSIEYVTPALIRHVKKL